MKNKSILFAFTAVLLILGLAACERPASTSPKSVPSATPESEFPVPGQTEDVMDQLESFATQTAIALGGGTAPIVETPNPPVEESQPAGQNTPEAPAAATDATPAAATEPPAAPAFAVPSPTPGIPSTWTLQKGEHPYCIARRFNVNPAEMLRLSGLSSETLFSPGTVLKIPQAGGSFPGARSLRAHPTTYNVSSGDTIYSVACIFGNVDPYAIAAANGLSDPYKLTPGTTIQIP